ncbi:MAG: SDR family oxidoreductase [Dehalococcoidia bacterium]|nr:SDR family oxidoreductase [Dehalococcoidia bacterium]MDH4299784.1 SDR family oxidoreductase [Dehalococcoidia bacterium]MDH4367802.1 SDR family oxidoreductase [Dehalococcoidia bacterium]
MKLKDKVAIVTGGGTGIGKAISLALASEGAAVVMAARNLSRLEKAAKDIKSKGGRAKAIQADISDHEQAKRMVAQAIKDFGQIDILVNNAARGTFNNADVVDMDPKEWDDCLAINLTGIMYCSREALKCMIPRKSGNIINISSVAGMSGVPKESPYGASKWGVIGFTETLAIEVGRFGIRVNCISPGATRTQEFEDWVKVSATDAGITYKEMMRRITNNNALRRIAEPSEVAACVVFLASDDSSAMTGHNLVVSCGFHLIHPNMIQ